MTEIKRPFSAAKSYNTNLVQFRPLHVIINVHVFLYITSTVSQVQGRAPKTVLCAQNPVYKTTFATIYYWENMK